MRTLPVCAINWGGKTPRSGRWQSPGFQRILPKHVTLSRSVAATAGRQRDFPRGTSCLLGGSPKPQVGEGLACADLCTRSDMQEVAGHGSPVRSVTPLIAGPGCGARGQQRVAGLASGCFIYGRHIFSDDGHRQNAHRSTEYPAYPGAEIQTNHRRKNQTECGNEGELPYRPSRGSLLTNAAPWPGIRNERLLRVWAPKPHSTNVKGLTYINVPTIPSKRGPF